MIIFPTQEQWDGIVMKYCGDECVEKAMQDLKNIIIKLNEEKI